MGESSTKAGSLGFFGYYRKYAKTGVHAVSAAALTALIGLASFAGNRWFVLLGIAVYVLPPVFLYLTGEGENVPSVVGDDTADANGDSYDKPDSHAGTDSSATDGAEIDSSASGATDGADAAPEATGSRVEAEEAATADAATDEGKGDDPRDTTPDATDPEGESAVSGVDPDATGIEPEWMEADAPTEASLLDVVSTDGDAFAVGEGGVVLARDGDGWEVAVESGPAANANPLRGVDATADGGAVWFAGDSGVLGRWDGRLTDHSAPKDQTSTWTDVAVTGKAGTERIHLVNGSGELLRGTYDDGSVEWGAIEKPGSGSSIAAIDFTDDDRGHLADTNQSVYETTDGGESYEEIGIEDANAAFTDVAATDSTVVVAGDDGSIFRHDGAVWTRLRPSESTLSAVDLGGKEGLAAGDAGAVFELVDGDWEAVETPTDADLTGIVCGTDKGDPDVAVGTAGTVIERER